MNNKSMIWILSLLLAGILFYFIYFSGKKEDEESEGGNGGGGNNIIQEAPVPQPPTTTGGGGGGADGVVTTSNPLDPYSGEGKQAVTNYIRSLIDAGEAETVRRQKKIGSDNLFANTRHDVSPAIKNFILESAGANDGYGVPLIPSDVDIEFMQQLEALKSFCDDAHEQLHGVYNANRDNFRNKLAQLCDFSNWGFRMLPANSDAIVEQIEKEYGRCKGSNRKKNECWNKNNVNLAGRETLANVTNFISETKKFEKAIRTYAIEKMAASGWDFIGF